jgi:hypothetical protein
VLPKPSTRHKTKVVPTFVKDSANPAFLYTALILWHCDYFLLINELQSLLLPPRPLYSTIYEGVFLYCIQTTERYHGLILSMEHHNLFLPSLRHDSSHCCSGLDGRCSFCHCSDTHGYRTHHSKSGRCNSKLWRRADAQPILSSVSSISSQPSAADSTSTTSVGLTTSPTVAPSPTVTQTCTAKSGKQISTVSSGAAAGAAIVCLIAGAAIAALALWFFWGRRKESRARNCDASSTALVHHEKGFTTNTIPLESRNPATLSITDAFPMPLEDKAITGEILKISNSIKNHVQSYYHASEISPGLLDIDDVKALGSDLPIPVATLSSLLDKKASREIALRFCVAWVVCSNMRPEASSSTGLLPTEVAECLRKMVESSRGSRGKSSMLFSEVPTNNIYSAYFVSSTMASDDSRLDADSICPRSIHCIGQSQRQHSCSSW